MTADDKYLKQLRLDLHLAEKRADEAEKKLAHERRLNDHYRRWLERIEQGDPAPRTCASHALDGAMGVP